MRKPNGNLKYLLLALFVHLGILVIFAPAYIISPGTKEALFEGRLRRKVKPAAPAERAVSEVKKTRISEVPVHLLKKKPDVVKIERKTKVPVAVGVPKTVIPKGARLSRRHRIKSDRIVSREKVRRQKTYKQFGKKFDISGKGKSVKASFTPVLARYRGGDWYKDPKSIPNLMKEINRRSNVTADEKPKVVSVSSEEIFDCPFVYFTGTRDFKFTNEEVEHLRKYLLQGGLVWADNGLPGRMSRFDIAFRREMKKVLPDRDFEPIPIGHKVFSSFYKFGEVPAAMNYRDDPLEMVKIDERMVVIYTLNDYGDFWETGLNEKGEVDNSLDENWENNRGPHWGRWQFENLNRESVESAYRLGINMVAYLLTR